MCTRAKYNDNKFSNIKSQTFFFWNIVCIFFVKYIFTFFYTSTSGQYPRSGVQTFDPSMCTPLLY